MELEQTIRDWGTPEWATPAVAAWIRSGGAIDRDLWVALRAAARDARTSRMLEDIEEHLSIDSLRAPRSAAVGSAIRTLHQALWPNGTGE